MSDLTIRSKPQPTVRSSRLLLAALLGLALAACDKSPPPSTSSGVAAEASRENELAARERTMAAREAAVAAKEQLDSETVARTAAAAEAEAVRAQAATAAAAVARAAKTTAAAEGNRLAAARSAADKQATRERAARADAQRRREDAEAATAKATASARPVEVAAGTRLAIALKQSLSSKTAQPGERFEAVLTSDVVAADGRVAVPAGATVVGTITDVVSGSRNIGTTPTIGLRFDHLLTAEGQRIPISGELDEQGASERGRDTAKILGGVAAGAVLGHQVRSDNRGKVIGGLLGGAIGAIAAKNTGTEVALSDGAPLTITLGASFTVTPAAGRAGG